MSIYRNETDLIDLTLITKDSSVIVSDNRNLKTVTIDDESKNLSSLKLNNFSELFFNGNNLKNLKSLHLQNIQSVNNSDFTNKLEFVSIINSRLENELKIDFTNIEYFVVQNSNVINLTVDSDLYEELETFDISNNNMESLTINKPFKSGIRFINLSGNLLCKPKFSFSDYDVRVDIYLDGNTEYPECIKDLNFASFFYIDENKNPLPITLDEINTY